jgi:hypothetical protein
VKPLLRKSNPGGNLLDDLDLQLLRRLSNHRCRLRVRELVNEHRDHDLNEAQVLERMERLVELGYVEPDHAFRITNKGAAAGLPPLHHHRPLSKAA